MWLLQADLEAYIHLIPATSDQDSLYYKFLDLVYGTNSAIPSFS